MEALASVLIDGLAVARLTRLVTADTITVGPRDAVVRWAYARDGRAQWLVELEEWASPSAAVQADQHPPKVARLITCPWCAGVWVAAGVATARLVAPRLWGRAAAALAAAEAAGLLAGWEG